MPYKVVLVLVDGMRPDGIAQCGHPYLGALRQEATHCFAARTVFPSITLPCHASLFFSVPPTRHGVTTNLWTPPVRPIDSLGDVAHAAGKKTAMLYNWEELRDLNRPGSLDYSHYQTGKLPHLECMESERQMTALAVDYLRREQPDFLFLYLGYTDSAGHRYGWMGPEYLQAVANASACIQTLREALGEECALLITADHGGHERIHGTEEPEDMVIPQLFCGGPFPKGRELPGCTILDLAPTAAALMELTPPRDWEGRNLLTLL